MNVWKKIIAASTTVAMVIMMFSGIGIINVNAIEAVYNFSELTDESYAVKQKNLEVFDGAVTLTSSVEDASKQSGLNFSVAMPDGSTTQFTSALKGKKIAATVTLEAGETLIVYYGGTDSGGSAAKAVNMQISDTSSNVVAVEETNDENKEAKPYIISYKSETGGTYKVEDKSDSTARTLMYAIVVTSSADFNPDNSVNPSAPTTPPSGESSSPQETAAPTKAPRPTVNPNSRSAIEIRAFKGWLETAYVTWTNPAQVEKYNVYVKGEGDSDYTKIDDELIRYYGSYYRADAMGLEAGKYTMKVAAVLDGVETDVKETGEITVLPQKREGYAFDPKSDHYNEKGVGGYKNDGTVKDDAQIIYIDNDNVNTVEHTVMIKNKATKATGLADILTLYKKVDAPLIIRVIGLIDGTKIKGLNSSGYIEVKEVSNITFEGVGNDATLYKFSPLLRTTDNIEVRNIGVMKFLDDGVSIDTDNFNAWIHNCEFFYGTPGKDSDQAKGDGSLDVKSGSDYCTFSYNHFWDSGKASLCGFEKDVYMGYHMTYHHNWFDHSDSRHPRIRGDIVHIYNNYYDGNSKYGVGATTGSSVFVENNVFRNCKYPVLISMQGSDIAGGSTGTFSNEDGGMIKMYGNQITGGNKVIDAKTNSTDFDAYIADTRNETVPKTFKAKRFINATKGDGTYNNFDTAADMYSYVPDDTQSVVVNVETYAGRVDGGDFEYEFDDSEADESHEIDTVLDAKIKNYTSTLNISYATNDYYPSTDTSAPAPTETVAPTPTETTEPAPTQSVVYDKANNEAIITFSQDTTATVIFASYDAEGRLSGICIKDNVELIDGETRIKADDSFESSANTVRVFVWSSITGSGSLKPLI